MALILENPESIDRFIRSHWRIVPDPTDAEFVRSPDLQLQQLACTGYLEGDCDDSATLAAALLVELSIPAWFIAIRQPRETEFSHVFLRTFTDHYADRILDIDPIVSLSQIPLSGYAEKMELQV